jgi:hypothetical protein
LPSNGKIPIITPLKIVGLIMRVKVYRNINNGLISIMSEKSRLVLSHSHSVLLENVTFNVNETGRQRVIQTNRKNVHAFAIGDLVGGEGFAGFKGREVSPCKPSHNHIVNQQLRYNPYESAEFRDQQQNPRTSAAACLIMNDGKIFATIN